MTDDEQRQITTVVLQEHKDAQNRLGCLRSKARRMVSPCREIADALAGRPKSNIDELIARFPSKSDVGSILQEIKAAESEITMLESEMDAQGFRAYIPARSGKIMPASDDD